MMKDPYVLFSVPFWDSRTITSSKPCRLELYRNRSFDSIITDLTMPEMDGLELISELTKSFLSVKVIAMTGGSESEGRLDTTKLLGARSTLQKPFLMDTLLSLVKYELER